MRFTRFGGWALVAAVLVAGCSADDGSSSAPAPPAESTTTTAAVFADPVAGPPARMCADWLGDVEPATPEWDEADRNNQACAVEGLRTMEDNPAVAAAAEANEAAGEGDFGSDPFRAPNRWAGERGRYELTTYADRDGNEWPAALFGPPPGDDGPHPGVLLACHACTPLPATTEQIAIWYWAAQALAEAGYVVLYAVTGGNSVPRTEDAADFLASTPAEPTAQGEVNPWHELVDQDRLGIVGHSGAAGLALEVGQSDDRFDAIVAWDPASSGTLGASEPTTPTMIQVADYSLRDGAVPRPEPPTPEPGSKYTYFDTITEAGTDVMQVAVRASTHIDWTRSVGGIEIPQMSDVLLTHSIYGEMVATYYTLAWFDRYLADDDAEADDALQRLTASGTVAFDDSADLHSIGAGFFDPEAAGTDDEAGNVPIEIAGIPVRNLLSFHYPSRYVLDGGALACDDLRAGCEDSTDG